MIERKRTVSRVFCWGASSLAASLFVPVLHAKSTAEFDAEITTEYPFDQGTVAPAQKAPTAPAATSQDARGRRLTPKAGPTPKAPAAAPQTSPASRPVPPTLAVPVTTPNGVPLVRVPWAETPMTLAAAQQDLSWRATLPSSGIAAWGMNPVQSPERALVEVIVGGGAVGVGVLLEGGAVLTSLSVIGRGLEVQVRFADGSTEAAMVRRTHRAYDLALLEPAGKRVRVGLPLARQVSDNLGLLYWGSPRPGPVASEKKESGVRAGLRGLRKQVPLNWFGSTWGADGVPIHAALRPPQLTEVGTPLVNVSGHLAALVTFACVVEEPRPSVDSRGCRVTRVGLTSGTLGEFLGMVDVDAAQVWFGVIGETVDTGWARGIRVTGVSPGSPAAHAGLSVANASTPGDVIVAIDATPVYEMEHLRAVVRAQRPGAKPVLTILRDGRLQQLGVSLPVVDRPLPVAETPEPWVSF